MKPLFLVNPNSSNGRTGRTFMGLLRSMTRRFPGLQFKLTRAKFHATALAREAALKGEHDVIVAVGGDGTFNEVLNGVMRAKEEKPELTPTLGVLPQGTGGDFRRSFPVEHRLDAYLKRLESPETTGFDVGRASFVDHDGLPKTHYFGNVLSLGMGGLVDQEVDKQDNQYSGKTSYFLASLQALRQIPLATLHCVARDAEQEVEVLLESRQMAICNGRYFGGGMNVAPNARVDDGLFDVVNFSSRQRLSLLAMAPALYDGKHLRRKDIQHFQASHLSIRLVDESMTSRFLLDVDGEALGRLPLTVDILPQALQLKL
jgi:YegS/Rv2252/BmrU family lipid kinase